ncbi:MAG: MarR family winged helix-turn-helix transcriptional regulator [Pseudomonadota bacterium]
MTTALSATALPVGCTSTKLRQLSRRVAQHYDAEVASLGLKTTQYSLLNHVARLGPVRPVDLAAALFMTASTLSRNVQVLVDAGWLATAAGPDARSRTVHITAAGEAKRREAQQHWRQAQQSLNERLGVERVAALHALIDESLTLLASPGDGEPEPDAC